MRLLRTLVLLLVVLLVCPVNGGAGQPAEGSANESTECPACTLKGLPLDILRDQKALWLAPFRLKRADLPATLAFVGTTAALVAIDRPVGQELSDSPPAAGYRFSRRVGQLGGGLPVVGVASLFYLVGRAGGDERARTTGVLGVRAVTDSAIIVQLLKTASQRPRPTRAGGLVRNHNADGEFFTGGRSFPSGHAAQAWALATVVAHQYGHRRWPRHWRGWVAPTAYGLAGLVAVARVGERRHFPADVFVGSALGYLIGRHVIHTAPFEPAATSRRWRDWHLVPYAPAGGGAALAMVWEF